MSSDTSKMEEVINKPDDQFEDTLIDLIDYNKETSEKEALIKEIDSKYETTNLNHIKPAASINSSTYSSAASSSSSSSSSNSSTNSSSSTSSTLSSPSQSNLNGSKSSPNDQEKDNTIKSNGNELEEIEMAIFEDLGKQATIVEHRAGSSSTTRYLKNFVASTTPFHFQDSAVSYRPNVDNHRSRLTSSNLTSQKNPISRKKRPIAQPILSQNIPGHKGEQEVEWLVNFIESGASNNQTLRKNGSNNNNKRSKSQSKKTSQRKSQTSTITNQNQQLMTQNDQVTNIKSIYNNTKPSRPTRSHRELNVTRQPVNLADSNKPKIVESEQSQIERKPNEEEEKNNAVTFADHIKLSDDDETAKYTFGFFDEQKPRSMITSRTSDQRRYMFKDNIDANSFNYQQIIEFISNAWKQSKESSVIKVPRTREAVE